MVQIEDNITKDSAPRSWGTEQATPTNLALLLLNIKALLLKSQIQRNKKLAYKYLILFKNANKNFNKINSLPERF
ncbi:hypothetical protein [Gilliamella sp. Occ4-3]|uniref:hypothetical protein n=1 Tax=Gilliamella sp. Occ4-3 TaxID=3120254 RepID=UPI00080E81BC|nr:hypothetical protein [Gilliamella apicola]OCG78033.1 hypothetical protein A9G44_02635 [Gilliamella apicola]